MKDFMDKVKVVLGKSFKGLTEHASVKSLVVKSIIYLIVPYVYIFVCGLIFDVLLKWYFMTTFIFVSMCVLWILAIVLIVISIVKYKKGASDGEACS